MLPMYEWANYLLISKALLGGLLRDTAWEIASRKMITRETCSRTGWTTAYTVDVFRRFGVTSMFGRGAAGIFFRAIVELIFALAAKHAVYERLSYTHMNATSSLPPT